MTRQNGNRSSKGMRNLRSAGLKAANSTVRTAEKAAVGLFRWATTDHSDFSKILTNMPSMGFFDMVRNILMQFLFAVVGAVISAVLMFVLIAYGIPLLITGHL